MKLFLTSSTITSNLVQEFEKFTGLKINGLKVAFITDAMYAPGFNTPEEIERWTKDDVEELTNLYQWDVDVIRLATDKNISLERFQEYDLIYMNGGLSGYLTNVIRETGFDKVLAELLKTKVYVGSSGGSMVMSKTQDVATWYPDESEPEAADVPGLGYVDFEIFPHYSDDQKDIIMQNIKPGIKYYLLKDQEAIMVEDDNIKVLGEERIIKLMMDH